MGKADGQKHVARVQRAGGAGGAGGHADAPGGQLQQHAFALDELEGEVHVVGQAALPAAVELGRGDLLENAADGMVAQRQLAVALGDDFLGGQFGGAGEADDAGHVLGGAAPPAFLLTAIEEVLKLHAAAHIQKADALGAVDLVGRRRQHVDAQLVHVDGLMAEGLHRVGVEDDARLVGGRRQLANRLDGADLVVGEHDGGQDGVRADGRLEVLNAHESVLVHGKIGHLEALALQRLAGVKHRVVLDGARDDVAPLGGVGPGEALEGPVVRFGAAAREEDFARRRADEAGQALAGGSHGVGGLLAQGVNGGRIAEMLGEVGGHGLHHFGANGRRGRMVKVDLPHGAPASALGMDSPGTVLGRGRAPPSKSSNLLEFNIIGLRRLSRTSYDCYHIHDDFPERRPR